jgi:hypothetical protein
MADDNIIIETDCETDQTDRVGWLRQVLERARDLGAYMEEEFPEGCYWPAAVQKIEDRAGALTIHWDDGLSIVCFGAAIERAWAEAGGQGPVRHVEPRQGWEETD